MIYNVRLSRILAIIFFSVYSGGRACIIPFLTLYFRFAGFSPVQAGCIRGFQTFAVILIAPLLTHKIKARSLHTTLMCFIFLSVAMYLCLLYTPTFKDGMYHPTENKSSNLSSLSKAEMSLIASSKEITKGVHLIESQPTTVGINFSTNIANTVSTSTKTVWTESPLLNSNIISTASSVETLQSRRTPSSISHKLQNFSTTHISTNNSHYNLLYNQDVSKKFANFKSLHKIENTVHIYDTEGYKSNMDYTTSGKRLLPKHKLLRIPRQAVTDLTNEITKFEIVTASILESLPVSVNDFLLNDSVNHSIGSKGNATPANRNENLLEWIKQFYPMALFWSISAVAILGELFGGSVERITTELWYKFLDEMDYLEKHDQYLIPSSFVSGLTVLLLGILHINYCDTTSNKECFQINFYTFSLLGSFSILLSYFFPVCYQQTVIMTDKRRRTVIFKMVCENLHISIALFAVLVAGMAHACFHDYFLCFLSDLGAGKYVIGAAVFIAFLSEILMVLLHHRLIKAITLYGCFGFSLMGYCIRFLLCSFVQIPWALAVSQILHSISFTVMWRAIDWYTDQISTPGLERNIYSMFSIVYWGFGYACGTILSGVMYSRLGPKQLFLIQALITFLSFGSFLGFHLCLPKLKAKTYSKLLFQEHQEDGELIYHGDTTDSDDEGIVLERIRRGNRLKK